MIKAIIFDLDDTIVDSEPLHVKAWEILLSKYGYTRQDIPKEKRDGYMGMRVLDIVIDIVNFLSIPDSVEKVYKERTKVFVTLIDEELKLKQGFLESVNLLTRYNYKVSLATSGAKIYVKKVLDKFMLNSLFDVIITGDDVFKGKPDPETYLKACEKLNLSPINCVVIEDAEKGVISAVNAGCKCIAIENKYTSNDKLSAANLILKNLLELKHEIVQSL